MSFYPLIFIRTISGLTQNAVRGIPLGQTAGQFILRDIQQWIHKSS